MNTTMADGARDRLVAQIGEALFGQPGLTLMELAEKVKEVRGSRPIGWFTEDYMTDKSATTYDASVADRWLAKGWPVSALFAAAQPSPAGQGDARAEFEAWARNEPRYFNIARSGAEYYYPKVQDAWTAWQAALAARQPVGETRRAAVEFFSANPVLAELYMRKHLGLPEDEDDAASEAFAEFADDYLTDGNGYAPASTYKACGNAFKEAWPDRAAATAAAREELKRLHGDDRTAGARRAEALNRADARGDSDDDAAPTAQAVDLGQLRKFAAAAVEFFDHGYDGHGRAKLNELLALIDSKAVGNG